MGKAEPAPTQYIYIYIYTYTYVGYCFREYVPPGRGQNSYGNIKKREDANSNYTQTQGPGTFCLTDRATELFHPPGKSPNLPDLAANLYIIG